MCAAQMNVTAKARYVTAVGGAAWVAAPYAYTTVPLGQFFSPYFGAWVVVGCGHPAVSLSAWGSFIQHIMIVTSLPSQTM